MLVCAQQCGGKNSQARSVRCAAVRSELSALQLRSSLRPAGWEVASVGSSDTTPGVVPFGTAFGAVAGAASPVALPRGVQPGTGMGPLAAILWLNCWMMPNVVSPERTALSPRGPDSPSHCGEEQGGRG